jgi:predicted amidohydrolase
VVHVAVVQQTSGLEPDANRNLIAELTPDDADLVVFPEAFARDFGTAGSDLSAYAESLDGPFVTEVERVAKERDTTIVAGLFETSGDPDRPYNTLVMRGAGQADYRKIHLYDSFGYRESDRLSAGEIEPVLTEVGGLTVGLMTCYDLRFPELSRLLVERGADVLVVPAAWMAGDRKVDHWRTLVLARAIENTAYVVAAAQPTPRYTGHSMVVDPRGDVLAEAGDGDEVITAVLERDVLEEARRTNPSLANRRM